jgi:hypothetical protein
LVNLRRLLAARLGRRLPGDTPEPAAPAPPPGPPPAERLDAARERLRREIDPPEDED